MTATALQDLAVRLVESRRFQIVITTLILFNAVVLGLETLPQVESAAGTIIVRLDRAIIAIFVVEILVRIFAHRGAYFKNGWNVFDFIIVFSSLFAAASGLGALRAFRVLRVLRLVTAIPRMRVVVSALLDSLPGIASVGLVLILIVYVFAVIGANLYGADHVALFGDVFVAMYTLFQVMTLEGWPSIASEVGSTHPRSWAFFVTFMLISTFTMLNLFVAIVVRVVEEDSDPWFEGLKENQRQIREDVAAIKRTVAQIAQKLDQ